jgi:hypothetical protein
MQGVDKEPAMVKSREFALELAAPVALAAAIGLLVSIVLGGATLLLAA